MFVMRRGYNTNNCNVFPTYSQWTASLKFVSLGSKSFIATCSGKIFNTSDLWISALTVNSIYMCIKQIPKSLILRITRLTAMGHTAYPHTARTNAQTIPAVH